MRTSIAVFVALAALIGISTAATTSYQLEAKKFMDDASNRYYKLYNKIAHETYTSNDKDIEDFEAVFNTLETIKALSSHIVEISKEASEFDLSKIQDEQIKRALWNLRKVGDLFVLGEDYFSMVLSLAALKTLPTDKDIEKYRKGNGNGSGDEVKLAYDPDIIAIMKNSSDVDELKYYWTTYRDKNSGWAIINFYSIVEALQNAAKALEIPVLEFWFRYYENKDFLDEMERVMEELREPYKQLHAFIRRELVNKYGESVVDPNGPIPDHLFQQVLAQAWTDGSVIENYFPKKDLPPYNDFVKDFDAQKMVDEVERFYTSVGFNPLGEKFRHDRLMVQEVDEDDTGDCHANIFDMTPDVYMLYCKEVDFRKFMQMHGYMGRVYYAMEKKDVPAYFFNSYGLEFPVGEAFILSATTPKHLSSIGIAKDFQFTDATLMNRHFRMAIHTMLNIPQFFVHTKVMTDLLNGSVQFENINRHYWSLMEQYAGIEPPVDRNDEVIDFPASFYLDIEENHQTQKFVSEILGYQFYRAFCAKTQSGGQLHNCDFYGNLSVGNDLKAMMKLGSSKPLKDVLSKIVPGKKPVISGDALIEYYTPILDWVKTKNAQNGVKIGWNHSKKKN